MADHSVTPRGRAANVSRRTLLSGIGSSSLAFSLPTIPLPTSPCNNALISYLQSRSAHEDFLARVLRPAYRYAEAADRAETYDEVIEHVFKLEDEAAALSSSRHDALRVLLLEPASNAEALRIKIRFAYEDRYQFEDHDGLFHAIVVDSERLLS